MLDAKELSAGQYVLKANLVDGKGVAGKEERVLATTSQGFTIGRFPVAKGNVGVGINEDNALIVDGQPFFPIISFATTPFNFREMKAVGFNTVVGPSMSANNPYPEEQIKEYLYVASKARLKVLCAAVSYIWGNPPQLSCRDPETMVRKFKDHPCLLGWFTGDEVFANRVSVAQMDKIYRTIRQSDPAHPVWLNMMQAEVSNFAGVVSVSDIVSFSSGVKLTLNGALDVNGPITIDAGGEVQVGEGCILKCLDDWTVRGTLILRPDSTAWLEHAATSTTRGKMTVTNSGSLIAKGTVEKPVIVKGSSYPRAMKGLDIHGAANIIMEHVNLVNVGGINCSTTPRAHKLAYLKGSGFYMWSSAKLHVCDSSVLLNLYSNASMELARCTINGKGPNFNQKLDKGWVISREDVDNKGAYTYWAGAKGVSWHAGSTAPTEKDDVILKDNVWSESDCVILDADAVCRNLTVDKDAKLVINKDKKLTVHGSVYTAQDFSLGAGAKIISDANATGCRRQ
ncbi:MAG: hypothetical protein PHT33_00320 [bacterium]|nr:hypothetical protein [bacterium]